MNIYQQKKLWKRLLLISAAMIFIGSIWYINLVTTKISDYERTKIKLWADAVNKRASIVNATDSFFDKLSQEERKRVELWAEANKRLISAGPTEDLTFYLSIISGNKTIPVVQTDENKKILTAINIDFNIDTVKYLRGNHEKEFSVYPPIKVNYYGNKKFYLYYKDSKLFSELKNVLNNQVKLLLTEIVANAPSVPIIITDSTRKKVISSGNIDTNKLKDEIFLAKEIGRMETDNTPIDIFIPGRGKCSVFYEHSYLETELKAFPYIQFLIIGVFLLIAYLLFSTSRRSEQNKEWLGLAKETAHQLGTPLSSLMAWTEYLKLKGMEEENLTEVKKDIKRLETITNRFSKIGSSPQLEPNDIIVVINEAVSYIKTRTSKKVKYILNLPPAGVIVPINIELFEWVIENLCKNAVDAMAGEGSIEINLYEESKHVIIDISDTGKGIPKSKFKTVFNPGFTSKKTGWGLGLTLSQRIIQNYHSGKIFVKSSAVNNGTTFRIIMKKKV